MSRKRKRKTKHRVIGINLPDRSSPAPKPPAGDQRNRRWLPPVVAVFAVLASGVLYGLQTHRWTVNEDVKEAAERLKDVPLTIGDWEGRDGEIPQEQLDQAGAEGHIFRYYRNRVTGEEVSVLIVCGAHGPISLHPPTVCFTSAGWKLERQQSAEVAWDGNSARAHFQVARFRKSSPTQTRLMRTYWSWNAAGTWETPQRPRFAYAGSSYLFKMYVSAPLPRETEPNDDSTPPADACLNFLRIFLPVLKQADI